MSTGWLGGQLRKMAYAFPSLKKKKHFKVVLIVAIALQMRVGKPDPGVSNSGLE